MVGPGQQPETPDFEFDVPAVHRVDCYFLLDNFGSPFTGRYRASIGLIANSPPVYEYRLTGFAMESQNGDLVNGRIDYSVPLGHGGLCGDVAVFHTSYVPGAGFQAINPTGYADGVTATLTYPLKRLFPAA